MAGRLRETTHSNEVERRGANPCGDLFKMKSRRPMFLLLPFSPKAETLALPWWSRSQLEGTRSHATPRRGAPGANGTGAAVVRKFSKHLQKSNIKRSKPGVIWVCQPKPGPYCTQRIPASKRPHSRQAGVTRRQFNSGRPGSLYSIR